MEDDFKELQRLLVKAERHCAKTAEALRQFHDAATEMVNDHGAKVGVTMAAFIPKNPK
jgi:hypothetical protein